VDPVDRTECLRRRAAPTQPSGVLVGALDPDRRAAFVLTQLFRLSYEEAASVCDCPPGTIRSRVARARGELIELLDAGSDVAAGQSSG
jgi:RNA polymerase sigma-70 factor (ECF subfamily)